ncbi:hypothetical protein [Chlorobium ferrooxidans]|nr:hypothetical protein [Chlorobium ferrooxidans]
MYRFRVEYYNKEHKRLLERYSCYDAIEKIVKNGFTVPEEEFHCYALFREQKRYEGWRTYQELKSKIPNRLSNFKEYFSTNDGLISSNFGQADDRDSHLTESIGIGGGLSLVSKLYDLTEADWEKIPVSNKKDLDFEIASNGKEFIEVEVKGAVVKNINRKSEVSGRAGEIEQKKIEKATRTNLKSSRIGVIVSVSDVCGEMPICRILDPEGDKYDMSPEKYRLIARLSYYYRELRTLGRFGLLSDLTNRIRTLYYSYDYEQLDGVVLLDVNKNKIALPLSAMYSKSTAGDFAFGEVIDLKNGRYYFYGMMYDVFDVLINQKFENISKYINTSRIESVKITARLKVNKNDDDEKERFRTIDMKGDINITPSGKVLGVCYII